MALGARVSYRGCDLPHLTLLQPTDAIWAVRLFSLSRRETAMPEVEAPLACERCCPNGREAENSKRSSRRRNRSDDSTRKLLIGREEDCHLRPESEFVSRHHCVLLLDEYTLRIRDLGSKNGTFVNGRRIGTSETILLHDDMISIGEMIGQIDLSQPGVVPPTDSPQRETSGPGSVARDRLFRGRHGSSRRPRRPPPIRPSAQSIPTPLCRTRCLPAVRTTGDTKTSLPAPAVRRLKPRRSRGESDWPQGLPPRSSGTPRPATRPIDPIAFGDS